TSRDASRIVLAGHQPAREVTRQSIGAVGRFLVDRHRLARRIFHAPGAMNIAEQQIAALLPPERTFRRPEIAAKARGKFLDRLRSVDDVCERRIELLDLFLRLCIGCPQAARSRKTTCGCEAQQMTT